MKRNLILLIVAIALSFLYLTTRSQAKPEVTYKTNNWNYESSTLGSRLKKINLPELKAEGEELHTHQHLDISAGGAPVEIPTDIGIAEDGSFIAPVHTHDTSGIIHIESPTSKKYYLGQFFDIWGIQFDRNCISGYCRSGENLFEVYVDGQLQTGNPRDIELLPHQQIFIYVGSPASRPKTIPSTYKFPADY